MNKPDYHDNLITPSYIFSKLDEEYNFTLDVCATKVNTKCERFFDITQNGLIQPWDGVCWCHPPYGRTMGAWVRKAYVETYRKNTTVVALLPSRTDTVYWHEYVMKAQEVRFIKGRIKYPELDNPSPFAQCLVIFNIPIIGNEQFHDRQKIPLLVSSVIF